MKIRTVILILTLFVTCNLKGQKQYNIDWEYKGLSFKEFVAKAENQLHIKIFYKETWVVNLKLSDYKVCKTLSCILDNLFNGTSLHYFINNSGNVVITGNYTVKALNAPPDTKENIIPQTLYSNYVKEQQPGEILSFSLGSPSERNIPGKAIVSGHITNKDTKEPLAGVTVFIQKLAVGTITNKLGNYTLALPRGNHLIKFSFIGMKEKLINLTLYGTGVLNVDLINSFVSLNEVIVSNQKNSVLQRSEIGAERINISSFKLLPTSMGEADIMKSLILIPGVKSVGEGSAGFNVRGGSADQNLILLYGAPIYNSSHFFGFFSAVNSDVIKDVTLYKGGIPSRYGGRISSVLDIEAREGDKKEFKGSAGISPITTQLMVEGPIIKDTLTYMLTGRTTYSNWIFGLIKDTALHNSRASFYDLNGKLTYNLDKNNKIDFSSYYSHDYFRFSTSTIYDYTNNIIALKWQHFFNNQFYSTFSINNSFYKYDVTNSDIPADEYVLSHQINSTGFKADFNWVKEKNELNFGLDINRYSVLPGNYNPASDSSKIISDNIEKEKAYEGALYLDDKFTLAKFLSVNVGMRMSSFFSIGPKTVYTYSPDYSKSKSTITDSLNFKPGEIYSKYAGPELRASLNFRLSEKNSLKINYNRTRQYIHLLSNSTSISPTDTWKLCDYYLKPEVGDQYATGFYQMLFKGKYETSVELYYKEIKNMVDFKGGSTLTMVENIEQYLMYTKGKAYGLELSLKKTTGKVQYSIGYTYSRTFVKSLGKFREEVVNAGNWYPANYDRPNDLIITFNYLYSRRLSFSADYSYSTGRPITYPLSTYRFRNILLVQYSDRNVYRIPNYSRLDVSCKVSGNLRSNKIAHPNLTFSVYNLLGRENPYSVYFKKEGQVYKGYLLSVFGRAMPSVTFNFDF
jgi:hypothetical protein